MARKPASRNEPAAEADSKSARTRQRILDAAAYVLSRKGYAGTRLTDVAEQAAVQAPAIYYYFPSREDLIEEVMFSGIAHMRQHVQGKLAELPATANAMRKIDTAVEAHLRYELEISDYTTAAIRNAGQIPETLAVRYTVEVDKYGDVWRKLFRQAKRDGVLREDIDVRAARMLVLGALNWASEWWNPRRGSLDAVVRTAQSMVHSGLSAEPSQETEKPRPSARKSVRKAS